MPSAKYLIRLDDAFAGMSPHWEIFENFFIENKIRPIVGVIPCNKYFNSNDENESLFWDKIRFWQSKGWTIGLHGYTHEKNTNENGIVGRGDASEFSGLSYEVQKKRITEAVKKFQKEDVKIDCWVAPWHSFDANTLSVLKNETSIRIISDGMSFRPFYDNEFYWIPVQLWGFLPFPFGTFTVCLHPNLMTPERVQRTLEKIRMHRKKIISYEMNILSKKPLPFYERGISWILVLLLRALKQ